MVAGEGIGEQGWDCGVGPAVAKTGQVNSSAVPALGTADAFLPPLTLSAGLVWSGWSLWRPNLFLRLLFCLGW